MSEAEYVTVSKLDSKKFWTLLTLLALESTTGHKFGYVSHQQDEDFYWNYKYIKQEIMRIDFWISKNLDNIPKIAAMKLWNLNLEKLHRTTWVRAGEYGFEVQ